MQVLTINAGSSSVRLTSFDCADIATPMRRSSARYAIDTESPVSQLRGFAEEHLHGEVSAIVHRIVHGGERFAQPCLIDAAVEAEIARLATLAPLHNPLALAWIKACREFFGGAVAQIAAFDTAFFVNLSPAARTYAVPRELTRKYGLRRYGFHGLAHEAMCRRWRALRPDIERGGRVISFQLGSGCSVAAVAHGVPQDTSMGFSPLEGLMMATRPGDTDPGLLLYVQRQERMTAQAMEQMLNHECGLTGIAGEADMRRLLARGDTEAGLAIEMYCRRARKYLGAYLAVLGGADAVLFGGGVGEHAPNMRWKVLEGMQWAGMDIDTERNLATVGTESRISHQNSDVDVWVVPVDEAAVLAEAAVTVLARPLGQGAGQ
jgi:acetate kinase